LEVTRDEPSLAKLPQHKLYQRLALIRSTLTTLRHTDRSRCYQPHANLFFFWKETNCRIFKIHLSCKAHPWSHAAFLAYELSPTT